MQVNITLQERNSPFPFILTEEINFRAFVDHLLMAVTVLGTDCSLSSFCIKTDTTQAVHLGQIRLIRAHYINLLVRTHNFVSRIQTTILIVRQMGPKVLENANSKFRRELYSNLPFVCK